MPKLAIKVLYGEMSTIVTDGVNMVPARATELGYRFRHPEVGEALRSALALAPTARPLVLEQRLRLGPVAAERAR